MSANPYMDDAGLGVTQYFLLRVPPYCQWMRWGVLGYDGFLVLLQTSADTNGVTMGGNYRSLETAQWVWGSNDTPAGSPPAADDTGRALKVSSTLSATSSSYRTACLPSLGRRIRPSRCTCSRTVPTACCNWAAPAWTRKP